jgi:hypothetical protein
MATPTQPLPQAPPPPPQQDTWDAVAAAKQKYPGLASEPDEKVGGFLSNPANFRNSFPEYAHLDDQTIGRNMAKYAPKVDDLTKETNAAARGAGESQRATMPELPKPEPTGPVTRFAAGAVDQAKTLIPKMPKTLSGLALQTAGIAYPGLTQGLAAAQEYENARKQGQGMIPSVGAGAGAASGVDVEGVRERAKRGDVAGVLGETAAAVAPMVLARPLSKVAEVAGENPTVQKVTSTITKPIRGPLDTLGLTAREPEKALTQAIQPGVNIPRAQESMPIAGGRLQQVKNAGLVKDAEGNPIKGFKSNADLLQGVKAAKTYVWDNLEKRTGSVAKLQADTAPVADAMEKSISKRTAEQFPDLAKKVQARADTYRGLKSFRDIENAIQDANDDLRNFYKRSSPTDSPITSETAATEAEVRALRTLLDEKVEALTGEGTADLKREYGALRDVERAAAKQHAIETRQKGATLWEGLAALRAAGDFVSGNMLGAAKGAATMAVGRRLALVRTPGWLIDQAFQGTKAFAPSAEIAAPPGVKIAGELGPGPTVTPPPADKSGPNPDAEAPKVAEGTRASRLGLLLPQKASTTLTPMERAPATAAAPGTTESPAINIQPSANRVLTGEREGNASKAASTLKPIFGRVENAPGEPGSPPPPAEPAPKAGPTAPVTEKPSPKPVTKAAKAAKPELKPESELNELRFQMRDLEKRINGTRDAYKMKPLIERYRKLESRRNELAPPKEEVFGAASQRQKGGQKRGEEVPTQGAAGADVKTAAPTMKRGLPTPEEYEDKLYAGGMRAVEAHQQAVDDIKAVDGTYTLPDAAIEAIRARINKVMGTEAAPKTEPPTLKPIPRSERLKAYNSLSAQDKLGIDAQMEELPHMPQILREGRMAQLKQFGESGTYLKERLAREFLDDQKNRARERQPGED